jgi:ATP-dependent DNA helicase PIF1
MQLSNEQECAFQRFKNGENLFISGQAGTGKTFLIKRMVQYLQENGTKYHICAMTGTAALLLNCDATTLHSWAGIGLCNGDRTKIIKSALKKRKKIINWLYPKVLIIDEVSMMSLKVFEIIETIARKARLNNQPFGNIQIIFTGDFYQLPPVETFGEPDTKSFCFESPLWNTVFKRENHIELKTIFRQLDPIYKSILSEIRTGTISEENIKILEKCKENRLNNDCIPTKIFPVRSKVDYINRLEFDKLKEQEFVFEFVVRKNCETYIETNTPVPKEILSSYCVLTEEEQNNELQQLILNSNYQQILRLKKGAVVMCIANIDIEQGICNGSQGIVIDILENTPVIKFYNGIIRKIPPFYRQNEEYPNIAIGQIPLILAWAVTIHKTQGATLNMAEIDIGSSIFEYGQTYVALSRIKTLDGLYIKNFNPSKIKANDIVKRFYDNFCECGAVVAATAPIDASCENKTVKITCDASHETKQETKQDVKIIKMCV